MGDPFSLSPYRGCGTSLTSFSSPAEEREREKERECSPFIVLESARSRNCAFVEKRFWKTISLFPDLSFSLSRPDYINARYIDAI